MSDVRHLASNLRIAYRRMDAAVAGGDEDRITQASYELEAARILLHKHMWGEDRTLQMFVSRPEEIEDAQAQA